MATQVLELTGLGGEGWSGAALIDPALIEGGVTAYLRFIRRIGNNFQVRLSATATADPENVGARVHRGIRDGRQRLYLRGRGARPSC